MAVGKRLAAAQRAWICFEDEAGQTLRPPKARTWARRGHTPVVTVTGKGSGRVSIAGLLDTAHQRLNAPIVLVWDNLNTRVSKAMRDFINGRDWLTVIRLPAYAPDLDPTEGVWSNPETRHRQPHRPRR